MKFSRKYVLLIIFGLLLITITYFTQRHETALLLTQYAVLFTIYSYFCFRKEPFRVKHIIIVGLVFRLVLLFAVPNLSEDVFRFIWDGKLWLSGVDAFQYTPIELMQAKVPLPDAQLYNQLNSPAYYTIYPPINQLLFILSALFNDTTISIIVLRILIISTEAVTLLHLSKLISANGFNHRKFIFYAFNPLVILELSGNLHFEAFVICFFVLALYFIHKKQWIKSALAMGLSIAFKILPIILLAAFFRKMKIWKYVAFVLISLAVVAATFTPLLNSSIFAGGGQSAQLYFQNFEFNASIYYLARAFGFWIKGYNIIETAGPFVIAIGFVCIVAYNLLVSIKVAIAERALFTWFIYCLFATTIHPWYIIPMVALSVLTTYKFPLLWSLLVFLTYAGYSTTRYTEQLWIIALEYILVIGFAVFEVSRARKKFKSPTL